VHVDSIEENIMGIAVNGVELSDATIARELAHH